MPYPTKGLRRLVEQAFLRHRSSNIKVKAVDYSNPIYNIDPIEGSQTFQWRGDWSSSESYIVNDLVLYLGSTWRALANNTNSAPSESNTNWTYLAKGGTNTTGGASELDELTDVILTSVQVGDIIQYNGTEWVNVGDPGSAISMLDDLEDVVTLTPATGEALVFDGTNWVNSAFQEPLQMGAFLARMGTAQLNIATGTTTTLIYDTEVSDDWGWYNPTTSIYTPQETGWYVLGGSAVLTPSVANKNVELYVTKNGTAEALCGFVQTSSTSATKVAGFVVVYANGTTDTFSLAIRHDFGVSTSDIDNSSNASTFFSGAYIGAAGSVGGVSSLDGLSDVVITSPTTDQLLKFNGTEWVNVTVSTGSGSSNTMWEPVRVVDDTGVTRSGVQVVDGATLAIGERVLVAGGSAEARGIYVVASGTWARATDADASSDFLQGKVVYVYDGDDHGGQFWVYSTSSNPTLDTDVLVFNFAPNSATETKWGLARIATQSEVDAGSSPDPEALVNPSTLAAYTGITDKLLITDYQARDRKDSVRVASTSAGTLASSFENGDMVDDITLATGNRILIKDQATGSQNGIYTVNASGAPTRATDADTSAKMTPQHTVRVEQGTLNGNKEFYCSNTGTITLGTTALTYADASTTVSAASETVAGIAEIATQTETDTGTDDARIVTPLKAATRFLAKAGGTLTGFLTLHADPTSAMHAVTKQYADGLTTGGGGGGIQVDFYDTAGSYTWTKPAGCTSVTIVCQGGGGGGGSGRRGATSTVRTGGGGGGGGSRTAAEVPASALSSSVSVVVGAAGGGGAAITADSTNGNAGTAGGDSSFGASPFIARAKGGNAGGAGSTAASTGGAIRTIGDGLFIGGAGGGSTSGSIGTSPANAVIPGGAGGGNVSGGNSSTGGGGGGDSAYGALGGSTGLPGESTGSTGLPGGGGGGGTASTVANAGSGGSGGDYGAGGGGGGGVLNGFSSGAGGSGGKGCVMIVSHLS